MSKLILKSLILATAVTATLAQSGERLQINNEVKQRINVLLTEQGYQVGKIKIEDGLYEAYAKKNGMKFEVFLDSDMKIVRVKED
jgi:hypothetical protein